LYNIILVALDKKGINNNTVKTNLKVGRVDGTGSVLMKSIILELPEKA